MALCTVTGIVYLPTGEPARSRVLVFSPANRSIYPDNFGGVLPDPVWVKTNRDGFLTVTLLDGTYVVQSEVYSGSVVVPDAESATFYEVLGGDAPLPPAPEATVDPSVSPLNPGVGDTVTLGLGTWSNGTPVGVLMQGEVNRTSEIVAGQWVPSVEGSFTWTVTATGAGGVTVADAIVGEVIPQFESLAVFRAKASDFNGTTIPGMSAQTTSPTMVGGAVRFNGSTDALLATVNFDLTGKTVLVAATPVGTANAAQSAIWSASGALGYVQAEARANPAGTFTGSHRSPSGMAFGATQILPSTSFSTFIDQVGRNAIYLTSYSPSVVRHIVGEQAGATTTSSGIVRNITTIKLGQGGTNIYASFDFREMIVLDTVDFNIVQSAIDYLNAEYSSDAPNFVPIFRADAAAMGDSISVGVGATGTNDFYRQTLKHFVATRTTNGFAGSRMSTFGLSGSQLAASFPVITSTATPFTGKGLAMGSWGTNDYGLSDGGVPMGATNSTDPLTFNGAMNVGWGNYLTNSPAGQPFYMFTPVPRFDQTGANTAGNTLLDYVNAIRAFVARIDSPRLRLVDMWGCGLLESETTDGLHPNDAGHARMAAWAFPIIKAYELGRPLP